MKHVLTRAELHDMVWSRAISKVAPELGISDVGLRKQCVKHRIPVPDARYWGLFHAGKPMTRTPLPPAQGVPDQVVIMGRGDDAQPLEIKQAVAKARAATKPIDIPDALHKMAKSTMALAKHRARDGDGVVVLADSDTFAIRAHRDTLERLGDFLNRFVRHALTRGYRFEPGKNGLAAVVEGERVPFKINQTIRRARHVATDEEKAKVARWDARHGRDWFRFEGRPSIPYYDYTPTGEMALEIEGWKAGCQRRFADSRAIKIEQRVDAILDAFHAWALQIKRDREAAKLEAVEAEERRKRRFEQAQRDALEQCRASYVLFLAGKLDERDKSVRVLEWLDEAGEGVEALATWLRQRIGQLDQALRAGPIVDDLEKWQDAALLEVSAKMRGY